MLTFNLSFTLNYEWKEKLPFDVSEIVSVSLSLLLSPFSNFFELFVLPTLLSVLLLFELLTVDGFFDASAELLALCDDAPDETVVGDIVLVPAAAATAAAVSVDCCLRLRYSLIESYIKKKVRIFTFILVQYIISSYKI